MQIDFPFFYYKVMTWAKPFGLFFLALGSTVSAGVLNQRSSDSYSLYAYGESIGGLPLYYADGEHIIKNTTYLSICR